MHAMMRPEAVTSHNIEGSSVSCLNIISEIFGGIGGLIWTQFIALIYRVDTVQDTLNFTFFPNLTFFIGDYTTRLLVMYYVAAVPPFLYGSNFPR